MEQEKLRKSEQKDVKILYNWKNDPITRKSAFSTNIVKLEEHKAWYKKIMNSPYVYQLIYEVDSQPVGQIRVEVEGKIGIIDYSIAPQCRGKGYGKRLLKLFVDYVKVNKIPITILRGLVKLDNDASKRCFLENDFLQVEKTEKYIVFEKKVGV